MHLDGEVCGWNLSVRRGYIESLDVSCHGYLGGFSLRLSASERNFESLLVKLGTLIRSRYACEILRFLF